MLPVLVALAVSLLLGHICALPATAESAVVEATHSHAPAEPHDSDGSHVASCDATLVNTAPACLRSADTPSAVLPAITTARDVPARAMAMATLSPPRRASDRSLFLLHASFLI
jgi:hypothetical protein